MSRSQNNDSPATRIFIGLSKYCKYTAVCNFPRNPEIPVFHCDEFEDDDFITGKEIHIKETISSAEQNSINEGPSISKKYLGLCRYVIFVIHAPIRNQKGESGIEKSMSKH